MRMDPGYDFWIENPKLRVLLDGKDVKNCVIADEESGFVEVYHTDKEGVVETVGGYLSTDVKKGKVKIIVEGKGNYEKTK